MSGRLLQAGWHSPTRTKERAVRGALEFASAVADYGSELSSSIPKQAHGSGRLFGDLFALIIAERSFGSTFLSPELNALSHELESVKIQTPEDALKRLVVLWALRGATASEILTEGLTRFVADVQNSQLPPAREAELLLLAGAADTDSQALKKVVQRRLRRIMELEPATLKAVVPDAQVPYRPPQKRS